MGVYMIIDHVGDPEALGVLGPKISGSGPVQSYRQTGWIGTVEVNWDAGL